MPRTHADRIYHIRKADQYLSVVLLDMNLEAGSNAVARAALQQIASQLDDYLQTYWDALAEGTAQEGEGKYGQRQKAEKK